MREHQSATRGRQASLGGAAAIAFMLANLALCAPLAQAATWSTVTTPNASGADHSALFDMACESQSTNACTAVGKKTTAGVSTPYAQYWNGSSWVNQTAAAPPGATASELQANTCLSSTSCVAAGTSNDGLRHILFGGVLEWNELVHPDDAESVQRDGFPPPWRLLRGDHRLYRSRL